MLVVPRLCHLTLAGWSAGNGRGGWCDAGSESSWSPLLSQSRPGMGVLGVGRVDAAGEAKDAPAVVNVEHIDVDTIVCGARAASHVAPLFAVPLQERNVFPCPR